MAAAASSSSWATKTVPFSSYSSALSDLARAAPAPRFVLFLGIDKETNAPWCPDVRRCAPAIRRACSGAGASLLEVDVGGRGEWKAPAPTPHPLRSPPLSLTGIPTLLAVDSHGKELGRIGPELEATSSEEEASGVAEAFVGKFV